MLQDIRRGLASVRRIAEQYRIQGVFGSVIELLDCDERFFTAVEVTAGNRYLFYLLWNLFCECSGRFFSG